MARPPKKKHSPSPLGQRLTLYRKKQGLTMTQLGEAVGVTESYISFLESGERSPSRKLIRRLVQHFYPQGNSALLDEWLVLAGFAPENPAFRPAAVDPYETYETQILQQPQDIRLYFAFIRALIKGGEFTRARQHIQRGFQLFDSTVEIQSLVGSLELAKGNYPQAIAAQQMALDFFLSQPVSTTHLQPGDLLLSLGVSHFLQGLHVLKTYHQLLPQSAKAAKPEKLKAQHAFLAARECFKQALDVDGTDIYIWDEYARVCFNLAHLANPTEKQKLWQETIACYQKVLKHPDNRLLGSEALLETAVFLGHAYSKCQNYDKAEEILSLLQAVRPEYSLVHYARACLLSLRGQQPADLDEALVHLQRAHQLASHKPSFVEEAMNDPDLALLRKQRTPAFKKLLNL